MVSGLKIYASNSITIDSINGENNILKINYKDIPIIDSKLELIADDIKELEISLIEAKKHNLSQIKYIEKEIILFKNEIKEILNATKNATIIIKNPILTSNTIVFELENQQIIYKTEPDTYSTFYLEFLKQKIILRPINRIYDSI